jgi:hypothetical protein
MTKAYHFYTSALGLVHHEDVAVISEICAALVFRD